MALETIRTQIDEIDTQLTGLYERRMKIVAQVAGEKRASGMAIRDRTREKAVLDRVTALVDEPVRPYVRELYQTIFDLSRSYEGRLMNRPSPLAETVHRACEEGERRRLPDRARVAVPGADGERSRKVCGQFFAHPDILCCTSLEGVFDAVEKGVCEYGAVPAETAAGSVTRVYDLMEKHGFYIAAACRVHADPAEEAVGSLDDAPVRLILFSRGCEICPGAGKISAVLRMPNGADGLGGILRRLSVAGLNVCKLESRPVYGADGECRVFLDFEADPRDGRAVALLCELEGCAQRFRFLGAYEEKQEGSPA